MILLVTAIALDPCSSRFAIMGASGKKASVKKQDEQKIQGFLAIFDVNSPSPCALWDAEDVILINVIICQFLYTCLHQ